MATPTTLALIQAGAAVGTLLLAILTVVQMRWLWRDRTAEMDRTIILQFLQPALDKLRGWVPLQNGYRRWDQMGRSQHPAPLNWQQFTREHPLIEPRINKKLRRKLVAIDGDYRELSSGMNNLRKLQESRLQEVLADHDYNPEKLRDVGIGFWHQGSSGGGGNFESADCWFATWLASHDICSQMFKQSRDYHQQPVVTGIFTTFPPLQEHGGDMGAAESLINAVYEHFDATPALAQFKQRVADLEQTASQVVAALNAEIGYLANGRPLKLWFSRMRAIS